MSAAKDKPYTGDWYDQRNQRRKETYHTDPEYREKVNSESRDGYRERAGVEMPFDPRDNRAKYVSMGKLRQIENEGDNATLCFTKSELADVLGRPTKQVQQWAADGRLPPPVKRGKVVGMERNWIAVYTPEEVGAIIDSIGEHLSQMIYYRKDHVDAIKAVHVAIDGVRG